MRMDFAEPRVASRLLAALLALLAAHAASAEDVYLEGVGSYQAGLDASQRTGRPYVLVFLDSHSEPCSRLMNDCYNDNALGQLVSDDLITLTVNIETEDCSDLQERFGVHSVPTIVLLAPGGRVLLTVFGYRSPDELVAEYRRAIAAMERERSAAEEEARRAEEAQREQREAEERRLREEEERRRAEEERQRSEETSWALVDVLSGAGKGGGTEGQLVSADPRGGQVRTTNGCMDAVFSERHGGPHDRRFLWSWRFARDVSRLAPGDEVDVELRVEREDQEPCPGSDAIVMWMSSPRGTGDVDTTVFDHEGPGERAAEIFSLQGSSVHWPDLATKENRVAVPRGATGELTWFQFEIGDSSGTEGRWFQVVYVYRRGAEASEALGAAGASNAHRTGGVSDPRSASVPRGSGGSGVRPPYGPSSGGPRSSASADHPPYSPPGDFRGGPSSTSSGTHPPYSAGSGTPSTGGSTDHPPFSGPTGGGAAGRQDTPYSRPSIDVSGLSLEDALRAVIPYLPFYDVSNQARANTPIRPLGMEYVSEDVPRALSVTFPGGANVNFSGSWTVGLHDPPSTDAQASQEFDRQRGYLTELSGDASYGDLGGLSGVGAKGSRGALDINFSGDPYTGTGRVVVVTSRMTLRVQASVAAHPGSTHGPRDKADVIEDCTRMARRWVLEMARVLLEAANSARWADGTGGTGGGGHPGSSAGDSPPYGPASRSDPSRGTGSADTPSAGASRPVPPYHPTPPAPQDGGDARSGGRSTGGGGSIPPPAAAGNDRHPPLHTPPTGGGSGTGDPSPRTGTGERPSELDVTGDGQVDVADALRALQMSVELIPEDLAADKDRDGRVTSRDATLILQLAASRRRGR